MSEQSQLNNDPNGDEDDPNGDEDEDIGKENDDDDDDDEVPNGEINDRIDD